MRFEDDANLNMTGDERKQGLTSKLLSIVCCRRRCCWPADGQTEKLRRRELEYVSTSSQQRKPGGQEPDAEDPEPQEETEDGGYDNEACIERRLTTGQPEVDMVSELYHRIEARRSSSVSATPMVDWKPVEFWTASPHRRELLQPPPPDDGRRASSSCEAHGFLPQLYEEEARRPRPEEEGRREEPLGDPHKPEKDGLGQLRFGVRYEPASRLLLVSVLAGRGLATRRCGPYVRACLLPDRRNGQRTAVGRQRTQSPTFEQTLAFELPSDAEARRRTLQLKVGALDGRAGHRQLGHVLLPLAGVNLAAGRPVWKPLVPCEEEQQDLGEIFVSLNYLPSAGRLNVDVIKAKQLLQMDLSGGSAPYVRVNLVLDNKPPKSKKTSRRKDPTNPSFDESFSFRVAPSALADASVVLSAWHCGGGLARDALVGRVVLGRFASGPDERRHWERVVSSHRSPVAQWHSLRSRPECDRLSPASRLLP